MTASVPHRIRAFVALALFATSSGGEQLLDGLLFHRQPARPEMVRVNAGDQCHAERCELGVRIVSPPPLPLAMGDGRFEPPSRRFVILAPANAPPSAVAAGPVGSRAPPVHS